MDVIAALRNSKKGQLKYDRNWCEEGRTQEILDDITSYLTEISISPKAITVIQTEVKKVEDDEIKSLHIVPKKQARKPADMPDIYFFELQAEMENPLLEYEQDRLKRIQDVFNAKKAEFKHHAEELIQQCEQEYHMLNRKNELDIKRRNVEMMKMKERALKEAEEKKLQKKEHYQSQAKKLSAKVQEAEMKQKKAEEELRKKQQEQEEYWLQLSTYQKETQDIVKKCIEKLKCCEHQKYLPPSVPETVNHMAELVQSINSFESAGKVLSIDDVFHASSLCKAAFEASHEIMNYIEQAKLKSLHEYEKQKINVPQNVSKEIKLPVTLETMDANHKLEEKKMPKTQKGLKELMAAFIAPDAAEDFSSIKDNLENTESSVQPFVDDPNKKKYRFQLQKALNIPINAISSVSGEHLKDKIDRLISLLSGKSTEVSGTYVSCDDACTQKYCANLIAKKFVEQGDRQISSQHSTAFPIAMAALGVWLKQPHIGQLILGHFYTKCPYLVPFYPPKQEGHSDIDYYTSLGYIYEDNVLEEKDKFLSRMSGYVRLYAAIVQSPLPPNSRSPHPHGIAWGWRWLSRMLNLEPRQDITATLLFDFLSVAGYALGKAYGKQFRKILHILCKDYFQKIVRVTPGGTSGPVERLEAFLHQTIKKGHTSPPEGILDARFWNTY